ncbi:hypothetical protein [Croceivirga radicis]|uniref:Uncharacterized protein n=1 Tax=Croceivirga radicis TaxID=1929488 RepID=A0A1V6LTE7_9FLAO|nr:hypothetical protein [Croceivirga radicis]OQD43453.1 hypothetical protein BUL40_06380 [Croceivirga radicis]
MELDKKIEVLLEKYFEANTTLAEEKLLRDYFAQDTIAEHLEAYRSMFGYFNKAKVDVYTKQVPLKPRRNVNFRWLSVAASVIVVIGLYFGQLGYRNYQEQKQLEQEQARYAYQQTKKALNLLAENFGKGTQKMAYLKTFEVSKDKIYNEN